MWIGGGDLLRLLRDELAVRCDGTPAGAAGAPPFALLLQEVWRYAPGLPVVEPSRIVPFSIDPGRQEGEDPDIVTAADRCGLSLVYVPSGRNGPDSGPRPSEDKGNAIVSNLILSEPVAFDLPLEGGRKVAVGATVTATDGTTLRVVSVHLDVASTLVRTVLSGNGTRVRQAMGLVDALTRTPDTGLGVDATVVGADMNTWAGNEAALQRMFMAFPQSPPWDGLPTRAGVPADHIFFEAESGARLAPSSYARIEDRYGSDHHPRRLSISRSESR
jgi:hypothetical protein